MKPHKPTPADALDKDSTRARILWFDQLIADIRFALRMLRKSPGFTAIAILTLALGIGANTAIFSVVQGVVLAPLPYGQPDRLVMVLLYNLNLKYSTDLSYPDFLDWQRSARPFQRIAAFTAQDYDLTLHGATEHLDGLQVSSGFFATLGVKPSIGRDFTADEDVRGGAPAVMISDHLWRTKFAANPAALGATLSLDAVDYTIVGVAPSQFRFGRQRYDVYTTLGQSNPQFLNDRTIHDIACIALLKPGVTQDQTQADMNIVQENIDKLYPALERGLKTQITPLKEALVGDVRGTLFLLLGGVGLVLLIACANFSNLLLARSAHRAREFAIRSALGASRMRIVRQLIVESVLLSLVGGGLALLTAKSELSAILAIIPVNLPRTEGISVNLTVLLFAFCVSLAVGIFFGLAPALKSSRVDLEVALKNGNRGSTASHHRAQSTLVIAQMALTFILLIGAGLLLRTIHHLWEVSPGFETQNVVTFKVPISPSAAKTAPDVRVAYRQLTDRLRHIPGVQDAALITPIPLSQQDNSGPFWFGSQPLTSVAEAPRTLFYWTSPQYLQTMGIPLLRGRFLVPQDTLASQPVVVIDSTLAHRYFSDTDPVGKSIMIPQWGVVQIIGVVGHVKHWGLGDTSASTQNEVYASIYQLADKWLPGFQSSLAVVIRTPLDTAAILPAVKEAIPQNGEQETIYDVTTMQELAANSMSSQRLPMILLGIFAGLALLLASVGIYGVISYSVALRAPEIGIRVALGAGKPTIFGMIIRHGLQLALTSLAIGTVAAFLLTRSLSSFSRLLYGVAANDPATFAAVFLVLILVAITACYIPARHAMRIDPLAALRQD
jgi:predicted permease